MANQDDDGIDLSFYTELRYPDPASAIISRFTASVRALINRVADDARNGGRSEFSGGSEDLFPTLADGVQRMRGHVDVFEATLLGVTEEDGRVLRNLFANVIADSGFAEIAEAHIDMPKTEEGKFDQQRGGDMLDKLQPLADKIWQLLDIIADAKKKLTAIGNFLCAIMRDIGIWGPALAKPAHDTVGHQLENKLNYVMPRVQSINDGQSAIDATVQRIEQLLTMTQQEVYKLEQKADTLGDLLGRTLVGDGWIVDPYRTRSGPNKVPPRNIKQELHDIEDRLKENCDIIENPPDNGNGNKGDHDKLTPELVPVLRDRRLKKIFIYAENTFSARTDNDRRRIRIRTPAFDVSGWLDLSRLRAGDIVEVEVRVSFANRRDILFARTAFNRRQLVSFADFAKGRNYLSGNNLMVALRQKASADNFATPIELAYQFVVESA